MIYQLPEMNLEHLLEAFNTGGSREPLASVSARHRYALDALVTCGFAELDCVYHSMYLDAVMPLAADFHRRLFDMESYQPNASELQVEEV